MFLLLNGGDFGNLQTELGQEFIGLRAFYLKFFQMGGIAVQADRLSFFGKDGLFGEIWEDEHEYSAGGTGYLVAEASAIEFECVDTSDDAIRAIEVELSLIHLQEVTFQLEIAVAGTAGGKN